MTMSDHLQNRGPWDGGRFLSYAFTLERSDTAKPDDEVDFDYPSFMARELIRGLQAYGEPELA